MVLNDEEIAAADPTNPLTQPAAQFMIDEIGLDSDTHKQRRRRRKLVMKAIATLEGRLQACTARLGTKGAPNLRAEIEELENELGALATDFGAVPPWDAPEWCHCDSA